MVREGEVRVCDEAAGFEDGRAVSPGTMAPLEAGRATQADCPLELPEGKQPHLHLEVSPSDLFQTPDLEN